MKKITLKNSNQLSKRLAQYGALSLAMAGVAEANGQISYTDVDPDFVGTQQSSFDIDFDGDTVIDATILQTSFAGGGGPIQLMRAEGTGIFVNVVGNYNYGVNFALGSTIGPGASVASFGDFCQGPGYPNSQFCGNNEDAYVGAAFDVSGNTHYGWIRLAPGASNSSFTVLDYAYNEVAGEAIEAGQTLSVDDFESNTFSHFYDKSTGKLSLESSSLSLSNIELYNILGQRVITQALSQSNEVIDMSSLKDGIYLAKVSVQGQAQTIKILKH